MGKPADMARAAATVATAISGFVDIINLSRCYLWIITRPTSTIPARRLRSPSGEAHQKSSNADGPRVISLLPTMIGWISLAPARQHANVVERHDRMFVGDVMRILRCANHFHTGPGQVAVFPTGWKGTWDIHETVRKVYSIF
jgi:hypothetical protein